MTRRLVGVCQPAKQKRGKDSRVDSNRRVFYARRLFKPCHKYALKASVFSVSTLQCLGGYYFRRDAVQRSRSSTVPIRVNNQLALKYRLQYGVVIASVIRTFSS